MKIRIRFFLVSITCLLVFSVFSRAAQIDFSKITSKTTHVAGNVYVLEITRQLNLRGKLLSRFYNLGISNGPDGILIIDIGYEPFAGMVQDAFDELGGGKLKFVVNTHWHLDHTGGNKVFGSEALIIAHTYTREKLASGHKYASGRVIQPAPKEALPVITFDDSLSLHFNGEEIRIFHIRYCHTRGDIIVYFTKSKVVHLGQFIDTRQFPSLDVDDGGDVEQYDEEMEKLIRRLPTDVKLISAHGPVSTLEYLKNYQRMIVETTNIIRQRIEEGKSLAEIEAEDLPDKFHSWSTDWMTTKDWIRRVYSSLIKKKN